MPPSLPKDSDDNLVKSPELYYTNEDITILHDIVVHAQELLRSLPERERVPTNALFHAYYTILPSIGIDVDHDSRYARILFKIGGMRRDGTLYEKFESVLSRMGIEIQFDQEDNNEEQKARSELQACQDSAPRTFLGSPAGDANQGTRCQRRNSEGSLWDATSGNYDGQRARRKYHSSPSKHDSIQDIESSNDTYVLPQTATHVVDQTLFDTESIDDRGKQEKDRSLGAWLNDKLDPNPSRRQARSDSTHGNIRVRRRSLPANDLNATAVSAVPLSDDTSPTFSAFSRSIEINQHDNVTGPLHNLNTLARTSETLMSIKVALVHQFHDKSLIRQVWIQWQNKALQLLEDNTNLRNLAKHRDRQILLRQAFDSWRTCMEERRQKAETEQFFKHLGRRAGRARDLFLLTKAFTHWTYNASDEVQRTTLARRHMLRARYFRAWREITAVNELKTRRQIIGRFFSVWKRQLTGTTLSTEKALALFTQNLVRKIFWSWFWAFCQRRAPLWWAHTLQKNQLATWAERTKQYNQLENLALKNYCYKVCQKTCHVWKIKTLDYAMQRHQGNEFRTTISLQTALIEWRFKIRLLPLLNGHRDSRKRTVQRSLFGLWLLRARQESQAATINRYKVMREAFLVWNDKLRYQALHFRISDRLVLQGLYKWVLSERLVLAQRLREQNLMQVSFTKLRKALQATNDKNARIDNAAQAFAERKVLMNVIQLWRDCLEAHSQRVRIASQFLNPKYQSGCLAKWLKRSQRIQQLQNWARDGNFYFTACKIFRSWKSATETVKRDKRRNMYSRFRRTKKVNLATGVLSAWRQQANAIIEAERTVAENNYNRKVVFCLEIFDQWRGRAEEVAELAILRKHFVLAKRLNEMKSSFTNQRGLVATAISFFEDHTMALCIKKWNRIALQLRVRQYLVLELREKSTKKTLRRVIIHWQQRAIGKQLQHEDNVQMLNSIGGSENRVWSFRERVEDSSEFDDREIEEWAERLDGAATSTPLPGYLKTPSKRMPKARVNAALPSTTPSAPLSTSAERILRAQYSGGSLPYFRRTFGKSLLSRKPTSAIIEDAKTIE